MLCKALVNLPDWPEATLRDVDPEDERIQGFLRAAYIVPMTRQRQAPSTPEQPSPAAKRAKAG